MFCYNFEIIDTIKIFMFCESIKNQMLFLSESILFENLDGKPTQTLISVITYSQIAASIIEASA